MIEILKELIATGEPIVIRVDGTDMRLRQPRLSRCEEAVFDADRSAPIYWPVAAITSAARRPPMQINAECLARARERPPRRWRL